MTDRIRVGIIGVGWGALVQAPAFQVVPEYELVAICSRTPDRAARAADRLGVAETSTDWHEFVRRDDLDLISVCTPTVLHHEQTLAALAAGKHVLCEKPMALNQEQAEEMLRAAEESGRAHAVCFEGRWSQARLPVWDMVRDGHLGTPYAARVNITADYWHPSRGLQSEWMYRAADGGGYLLGMASHDIDYLSCLFGPPEAVCADIRTSVPLRTRPDGGELVVDADDTSAVLLRMASGMIASVNVCAVGLHADSDYRLEAFGSEGTVTIDGTVFSAGIRAGRVGDDGLSVVPGSTRMPRSGLPIPGGRTASAIRMMALMLEDWLPAFSGDPAPGVPTLRDGLLVQRVIDAAHRSSRGEGWVGI
jgi:predicted dehydrogenase